MKLNTEFLKLPLRFDVHRLAQEVAQFSATEWRRHPQGHVGNSAIPLISVGGDPNQDDVKGAMRPTPFLDRCPYIRQILASLSCVLGRCRLMRIAGQGEATLHVDTNYYWMHHVRVHVPAITFPEVQFVCNNRALHMPAGEAWIFDTWKLHNVLNPVPHARIHLVADTVGSAAFWELVTQAERPFDPQAGPASPPRFVPFQSGFEPELKLERCNFPIVMSPWEQRLLVIGIFDDLRMGDAAPEMLNALETDLERFHQHWASLWARFADGEPGWSAFQSARAKLDEALAYYANQLRLANGVDAVEALRQAIVRPALNPELARRPLETPKENPATTAGFPAPATSGGVEFDRPVFIVAAPRSGSSLLFETLSYSPDFWTVGGESHEVFESIPRLRPEQRGFDSNRLTEFDADATTVREVEEGFVVQLRDHVGRKPTGSRIRFLEKTPKNALRIPFLRAVFPDARFIFLWREPAENLSSIIEAWRSGRFVTYANLPGWTGLPWSLLLIPNWRELIDRDLGTVAAAQWRSANEHILHDLAGLPADQWTTVSYAELTANPQRTIERLCQFAEVRWDQQLPASLPLSRHTLTAPAANKWRRNADLIEPFLPALTELTARLNATGKQEQRTPVSVPPNAQTVKLAAPSDSESLHAVCTPSMPRLLDELGISLLISTYQAGKLIIVRQQHGKVNTHFRSFATPMGLAFDRDRLMIGTKYDVLEFRNQPALARRLDPPDLHDACFLPRSTHCTGDIRVHEMAFARGELWIVNTRFSCLCTLDAAHSFVPRWRPDFVSELAADDRCHLNGLSIRDGQPRYVTCLGMTNHPAGWRKHKASGGGIIDVMTNDIIVQGLSMPHSPRWHDGKLWFLESGKGTLSVLDPVTQPPRTVACLPGFTRGLDFHDRFAFVGLSQVRESAMFSGIPITENRAERTCGLWVIDTHTGQTAALLRFDSGVQEIFAVQVLPNMRFPDVISDSEDMLANAFVVPD